MARRDALLDASIKANAVILDTDMKKRVHEGGYTRVDPALVASLFNVPVMYRKLERLLGGFIRQGEAAGILVNGDRSRGLVHMTCAHELGHYFMGHESTADQELDHGPSAALVERQADQFAYSLLAPRWLVASVMASRKWALPDLTRPFVVYQMSLRLGISYTAMAWSLQRLGLITTLIVERLLRTQPKALKQDAIGQHPLAEANVDVWVLDGADRDHVLEPGQGDLFVVDLPNNVGSGYLWTMDDLKSEGFQLAPPRVDRRVHPAGDARNVVVGGTATMRYELRPPATFQNRPTSSAEPIPLSDLRREVQIQETQPWSARSTPIDTFEFRAEYEPTEDGLTVSERLTRIARAKFSQ